MRRSAMTVDKLGAIGAFAIVAIAIAWVLLSGEDLSEEDRIRAAITQVAQGAREADIGKTFEPISDSYAAEGFDRQQLKGYIFSQYNRRGPVSVVLGPIDVVLESDEVGRAHFEAAIADGIDLSALDLVPDNADSFEFRVELRKEDGDWKVTTHQHRALSGRNYELSLE